MTMRPYRRECLHCGRVFYTYGTSPVQWCASCVKKYHAEITRLILERGSDAVQERAIELDNIIRRTELEW